MDVIQADESHIDAAWEIIDRCRVALRDRGIPQWDDVYPTRANVVADVERGGLFVLIESGICQGTVAVDANQDAQYATVSWTTEEPALVVHRLCVDPNAQKRGFGMRLMDFVEEYAGRNGYSSIRLDAFSENPDSFALYRRRGYREAGQVFFARRSLPFSCFELAIGVRPRPGE